MTSADETIFYVGGAVAGLLILIIILLLIILCLMVLNLRKSNRLKRADNQHPGEELSKANPTPPWDNPIYGGVHTNSATDAMHDTVVESAQQPKGNPEMTQSYDYVDDDAFERKPNIPEITYTAPQPNYNSIQGGADGRETTDNYDYISHEVFRGKPNVPEVTGTAPRPNYGKLEGVQSLACEPVASAKASPSGKKPREYLYSVPMKKRSLSTSAGHESTDQYSRLQHPGPKHIIRQTRYSVPTFTEDENGGTAGCSYYNVVISSSTPESNPQPVEGESCYSDDNPPPLPPPITDPEFQSPQTGNGATTEESYVHSAALPQDQGNRSSLMGMEEALYDYAL